MYIFSRQSSNDTMPGIIYNNDYMLTGFSFTDLYCIHIPMDFNSNYELECQGDEILLADDTYLILGITDDSSRNYLENEAVNHRKDSMFSSKTETHKIQ